MFKIWVVFGWGIIALEAFLVIAAIYSRDMGDDAAGRGMARGFGIIGLVFLLIIGAAFYFSQRAHSWPAVIASTVLLTVPFLIFFGTDLESYIHRLSSNIESRKVGRYPEPAQRQLAKAIDEDDFEAMRKVLATPPNLSGRDGAGWDLLSYAVSATNVARPDADNVKSVESVRLLLEAGMDPNQSRDCYGSATFAGLAYNVSRPGANGNEANPAGAEVFRLFLEHGANPNILSERQPLIFSVWTNIDSLNALLDHGADINLRDEAGDTPLLFYLYNGRWDAALVALERGADIKVQNNSGTTPEIALANGRHIVEDISQNPLPEAYFKLKTALERRRAAESAKGRTDART